MGLQELGSKAIRYSEFSKTVVKIILSTKTCPTAHPCDPQGNTGAPGLPGLVGFPGVGIQGEKARPQKCSEYDFV